MSQREQPREPAGSPHGGWWTSTANAVGSASPTHSRGDWVEKQAKKKFDAITEGGVLTAPEGGIVEELRGEAAGRTKYLWGEEARKEEEAFRSRLDPTRVWKVWANDDAYRARDLGDKAEHDRLMGGPGLREVVETPQRDYRNNYSDKLLSESQRAELLPKQIGGVDRASLDLGTGYQGERVLDEKRTNTMTPTTSKVLAERIIDKDLKEAFKEPAKDWKPGYIPYDKTTDAEKAEYIAAERQKVSDAVKQVREQYGSPENLRAHMEKLIVDDLDDTSPAMMMNQKTLGVLLSGEQNGMYPVQSPLKNYAEGVKSSVSAARDKSSRTGYLLTRTFHVDAQGLGIPITAPGSERPVHGLTILSDRTSKEEQQAMDAVSQYGGRTPVLVIYKNSLKSGATVTSDDSLNSQKIPVPYDRPTILAIAPGHLGESDGDETMGRIDDILKRNVTHGSTFRRSGENGKYGYDEVQFHKRPTAKDIKHVIFSKEPAAAVKKKLLGLGATWSVTSNME